MDEQIMSYFCAEDDPDILKALDGEELKYKERILKFNDYNWKQERIMLITPTTIINVKSKKTDILS